MYSYSLDKLKRLTEVETGKDIKQLSNAQFPGTHCPLFGVALTAGYIKDLFTLVVGTDECTFYTKTFTMERANASGSSDNHFLSFAINQDDVVFGCHDKLEKAVLHINRKYRPKAILLVTTCVLEVIGEDFDALVYSLQDQIQAKLMVVRAEHFKCHNHIPGIERTLEAAAGLMEQQPVQAKTINILGHRYNGVEDTELLKLLLQKGVGINLVIPSSCSVDSLAAAPSAALNIVTDFSALPLAEQMKTKFDTDYVYFDKYLNLDRITAGYKAVAEKLGICLDKEILQLRKSAEDAVKKANNILYSKTFIYGNTPLLAFEISSFLCSLGMKPVLLQARDLYANDHVYIKEIMDMGHNPHVCRIANIAPLQQLYDVLQPNIYIGHENPVKLMEKGIVQVTMDGVAKKLGFEVPILVMQALADSVCAFETLAGKEHYHHAAL
ncbi:MAG: oxalate:formate antiporter [Dethiobacter sp.]|nr:oxalate:formate antiporter [Dethiobacter sp.]